MVQLYQSYIKMNVDLLIFGRLVTLNEQVGQSWHSDMFNSSKEIDLRIYKITIGVEQIFLILTFQVSEVFLVEVGK